MTFENAKVVLKGKGILQSSDKMFGQKVKKQLKEPWFKTSYKKYNKDTAKVNEYIGALRAEMSRPY